MEAIAIRFKRTVVQASHVAWHLGIGDVWSFQDMTSHVVIQAILSKKPLPGVPDVARKLCVAALARLNSYQVPPSTGPLAHPNWSYRDCLRKRRQGVLAAITSAQGCSAAAHVSDCGRDLSRAEKDNGWLTRTG